MIRNIVVLTVFFLGINSFSYGKGSVFDSLSKEIELYGDTLIINNILVADRGIESVYLEEVEFGIEYCEAHHQYDWLVQFFLIKARNNIELENISECVFYCLQVLEVFNEYHLSIEYKKEAYIILSEGFQEMGAFEESIKNRKRYLELTNWSHWDSEVTNSLSFIGNLYVRTGVYDSAYNYFEQAKVYGEQFNKERKVAEALNNLGLTVYKLREFDSAAVYFEESLKIYKTKHTAQDSLRVGIITGNLAICYPFKTETEKIFRLIDEQIKITKKYKDYDALSTAYFEKCNTFYNLKDYKNTQVYLDSFLATNLLRKQNEATRYQRLGIYGSSRFVARILRDFDKTMYYNDLYEGLNDSLNGVSVKNELIQSITQYKLSGVKSDLKLKKAELDRSLNEIKAMEREEKFSRMKIFSGSLIAVLLLAIAGITIKKMRHDHEKKIEIKELNEQMLKASVEYKTDRLTQTALSLTRKVDFSKELIGKLSKVKGIEAKDLSAIKVFVSNEFRMDESFLEMEGYISDLSKDFFVKLKARFPGLSESEVKLCGFIKLGLSNKEISLIKSIEPNSVKVAKNRLRRKLGLSPTTRIVECLNEMGK